jgi:hypothetical protein
MNHQPFENWLLSGELLTPEHKRELQAHLRTCASCAALAETDLALRCARLTSPAPGFSARFQTRLARQRKAQRRQHIIGTIILVIGGSILLSWLSLPFWLRLVSSPAEMLGTWLSLLVFALVSLHTVGEIGSVILRLLPDFIPSYVWMISASILFGLSLLWAVSIWKLTHLSQGVSQ